MNDYNFGNFLYELRKEKGISQAELGDRMGVSNKAVSKWEMGISKPRPAMLVALAGYFGVTVEELMAGRRFDKPQETADGNTGREAPQELSDASASRRREIVEAIGVQVKEYRRHTRWMKFWIITTVAIPFAIFIYMWIIDACGAIEAPWVPVLAVSLVLFWPIAFLLIWVYLAATRRQKRLLYAMFPAWEAVIKELLVPARKKKPQYKMTKWEKISCLVIGVGALLLNTAMIFNEYYSYPHWLFVIIADVAFFLLLYATAFLVVFIVRIIRFAVKQRKSK